MRVHSGLSFNQIDELCQPVGQWEVVGPTGQYYGRFETRPRPDQIPLYAMVKKVDPSAMTVRIVDGKPVMGGVGGVGEPADYVVARIEAKDEAGNFVPGARLIVSGLVLRGDSGNPETVYVPFFAKIADGGGNIVVNSFELRSAAKNAADTGLISSSVFEFNLLFQLSKPGMKTEKWTLSEKDPVVKEVRTVVLRRETTPAATSAPDPSTTPAPGVAPAPSGPGSSGAATSPWPVLAMAGGFAVLLAVLFLKK